MEYRTDIKTGNKLSVLGFGCMRFPRNLAQIDFNRTEDLIVKAVQAGINYFDTAYIYGGSEEILGRILAKNNLRSKIFLATKLPLVKCKTYGDFDALFEQQLERLRTDYIDYYLMHNLGSAALWESLCKLGIEQWIREKKEAGLIRNTGFSFHGIHNEFLRLLDVYPWDFCQIQYNYINVNYQAGEAGLRAAASKGLPVIIMEPLLGGKLAAGLPQKAAAVFRAADASLTPAAQALRWLWNQREVTVVLSGMNDSSQLEDNIQAARNARAGMLTAADERVYQSAVKIIEASYKIPCTGCNYCMPCPQNVNIPACFAAYNISYAAGMVDGLLQYLTSTAVLNTRENYAASRCISCGSCEKKCPQHIPVVSSLRRVVRRMEPFWIKPVFSLIRKLFG
jgi:predicted aldo/keto reductase-like oxidoreductase